VVKLLVKFENCAMTILFRTSFDVTFKLLVVAMSSKVLVVVGPHWERLVFTHWALYFLEFARIGMSFAMLLKLATAHGYLPTSGNIARKRHNVSKNSEVAIETAVMLERF
jgi:hypothetical protein